MTTELLEQDSVQQFIGECLQAIRSEAQYEETKLMLRDLMMQTPDSPDNPFNGLMEFLAFAIEQWEEKHFPIREATPREVLRFLMEQHDLSQDDLRDEIGTQGVVSEVLSGRRRLNTRQIEALSKRFNISPAVFFHKNQSAIA